MTALERQEAIDEHVGRRLHAAAMASGMDFTLLAAEIGVTPAQLDDICLGRTRIDAASLYQAARLLSVEVGWFFEGLP